MSSNAVYLRLVIRYSIAAPAHSYDSFPLTVSHPMCTLLRSSDSTRHGLAARLVHTEQSRSESGMSTSPQDLRRNPHSQSCISFTGLRLHSELNASRCIRLLLASPRSSTTCGGEPAGLIGRLISDTVENAYSTATTTSHSRRIPPQHNPTAAHQVAAFARCWWLLLGTTCSAYATSDVLLTIAHSRLLFCSGNDPLVRCAALPRQAGEARHNRPPH